MCRKSVEAHRKGRPRAKRVNRLCKMNSDSQKLTMTGVHPFQIYGHTAQGASNAQVNAMCRSLKLGTVLGKTQACPISTVAWFFGAKRVPQTAARVEQISEWISLWRNCNVDTRRRIRQVCRKKAPCWPVTPVAGIKLQDLSPPPSALFWKPDGNRAHRVFGRHWMAVPLWMALCSTRRRLLTVFPVKWRCKHGKQRPDILPVPVWRKVSSQISQRKPDLSRSKKEIS